MAFPGRRKPPEEGMAGLFGSGQKPSAAEPRLDKVEQWRYDTLRDAGYTESQSLMLTLDRSVDLHEAVRLAAKASPDLAYRIMAA